MRLKFFIRSKKRTSGRNNIGHITSYHRGGGYKKHYRLIDFTRKLYDIPAGFLSYIIDPNRNSLIALICYSNGFLSYILGAKNLHFSNFIISSLLAPRFPATHSILANMPIGSQIHNIEFFVNLGGKAIRSGGCWGQLLRKKQKYVFIKLASGDIRKFPIHNFASIGSLTNRFTIPLKKAGHNRILGYKSIVRGVAMNPVDHPLGGGEGKSSGGRPSVSPWGILTKGHWKTRSKKKKLHFI